MCKRLVSNDDSDLFIQLLLRVLVAAKHCVAGGLIELALLFSV